MLWKLLFSDTRQEQPFRPVLFFFDEIGNLERADGQHRSFQACLRSNLQHTPGLVSLMTVSNWEQLNAMFHDYEAPFYGTAIKKFPQLEHAFLQFCVSEINARYGSCFEAANLTRQFGLFGEICGHPGRLIQTLIYAAEMGLSGSHGVAAAARDLRASWR